MSVTDSPIPHPPALRIEALADAGGAADETLTLPFEQRQRSRARVRLDGGREVGLFLPRGTVLRSGDRLRLSDGRVVEVRAAPESVSTALAADPILLARAAYHLGNRHVALQVGAGWVRYLHDHVLDDMVRALGLDVRAERAPFEPESGAYGGHGHDHAAGHRHDHHR
ncbi:MAG: urease accessory protein UreE [Ectothiorhodospiraceae bacterium]|nr:urease accessory protein UreE [Chromatiales bacterium]MCP5157105.1 urease accessory protein UreE [Ectothiorhodospiraceae bacterium]